MNTFFISRLTQACPKRLQRDHNNKQHWLHQNRYHGKWYRVVFERYICPDFDTNFPYTSSVNSLRTGHGFGSLGSVRISVHSLLNILICYIVRLQRAIIRRLSLVVFKKLKQTFYYTLTVFWLQTGHVQLFNKPSGVARSVKSLNFVLYKTY